MLLDNPNKCASANPDFIYDEACLDIFNALNSSVTVEGQYEECVGCDFKNFATLAPNKNISLLINTKFNMQMRILKDGSYICNWTSELLEHYRYGWNVTDNNKCSNLYIKEVADNSYIPILSAFIILFFFGTIWYMVKCIYKCTKNNDIWRRYLIFNNNREDTANLSDSGPLIIERPPKPIKHPNRIKSIDVFRGGCVIVMIFVNYGGGQYWFFKHSVWNGLTVADLVFPWFIWIMGFSYMISLSNKLRRAEPRRQLVVEVLRRSAILIFLGVMMNSHGKNLPISELRFPGVLQHIGVTYLIIGLIESVLAKRIHNSEGYGRFTIIQDILGAVPQWLIVIVLVVVHTCVTFLVEVPGCGKGYLGPGGLHEHGKYDNCTGGIAGYIDREVFGTHMYKNPTCHQLYETKVMFDPEGIFSTLTTVFLAYMGVQAGRIMYMYSSPSEKIIRWLIWGLVTGLAGGILCNFSKNGGTIPINKNLWSLSFVLVLGGLAFILQSFLYFIVDIKRKWGGRPFFYPGMNPIAVYVGHCIVQHTFPFAWVPSVQTHSAYLGMNLWGTGVWIAISILMYKKNIFIKI